MSPKERKHKNYLTFYRLSQLDDRPRTLTSFTIASDYNLAIIDTPVESNQPAGIFHNEAIQPLNGLSQRQKEAVMRFSGAPYVLVYKDKFQSPATASRAA